MTRGTLSRCTLSIRPRRKCWTLALFPKATASLTCTSFQPEQSLRTRSSTWWPSVASLQLFDDLVKADLRDGKPLAELMPVLEQFIQGTYESEKLKEIAKYLSADKIRVLRELLTDKKAIKYIHGPPGTGKTYLLMVLICIALLCDPPAGSDDERNLPVDAGAQLSAMYYDKVDQSAPLRPVNMATHMKVLLTSGQNSAVDDVVPGAL